MTPRVLLVQSCIYVMVVRSYSFFQTPAVMPHFAISLTTTGALMESQLNNTPCKYRLRKCSKTDSDISPCLSRPSLTFTPLTATRQSPPGDLVMCNSWIRGNQICPLPEVLKSCGAGSWKIMRPLGRTRGSGSRTRSVGAERWRQLLWRPQTDKCEPLLC